MEPPPPERWHYTFRLDDTLSSLQATLCFSGDIRPERLRPPKSDAVGLLTQVELLSGWSRVPVAFESYSDGFIELANADADCVGYRVDLKLAEEFGVDDVQTFGRDLYASPDIWLWEPHPRPESGVVISARFELPDGVEAASPWPWDPELEAHRLDPSSFLWASYGGFTRNRMETLEVAGSRLRVVFFGDRFNAVEQTHVLRWIETSAGGVATLFEERFPVDEALVLVTPTMWGNRVSFGAAARGGGPTVMLLVGANPTPASLRGDWITIHELLHLGVPLIERDDAWLSEGLATYYGPILRARAGMTTPRAAWEELHAGFRRGERAWRNSQETLLESSERFSSAWRVYWGGAAIVFLADLDLRLADGDSLDERVQHLNSCCLDKRWPANALLEAATSDGRLRTFCEGYLQTAAFPDLSHAYERLGLRFDDRGLLLTRSGEPGAELRRAIMGTDVD